MAKSKECKKKNATLEKNEYVGVTTKVQQIRRELLEKQNQMKNILIPQHMLEEEKEMRT